MYKEMSINELIQLESVDMSKFKKEFSYEDVRELDNKLNVFDTFNKYGVTVIGKHYILRDWREQTYKMGRYATYLKENYGLDLNDINIEFNRIKAKRASFKNIQFKIESHDTIADYYDHDYSNFSGSLGGSCMRGNGERYQNIVDCLDNKNDMGIAVLLDGDDNLIARSLLWKNKYYDKIYANNDALVTLLKDHLENNDYMSISNVQEEVAIGLSSGIQGKQVPYMDNVRYYSEYYGTLSTCNYYATASFDEGDGYVWNNRCDNCGDYCSGDDYTELHNGDTICDCCKHLITYAEDTGEYYYNKDVVHLADEDIWVTRDADYYTARDTGLHYKDCGELYYDESTNEYYVDNYALVEAYDTGNYFSNIDDLYYTEDSERYFECPSDLFYKDGCWYEDEIEDEDEEEKQKELLRKSRDIKETVRRNNLLKYIPKQPKLIQFLIDNKADEKFIISLQNASSYTRKQAFIREDNYDAIGSSFTWCVTKEGHSYWNKLSNDFNRLIDA